MKFTDQQKVVIFVDGFGELDAVYNAAEDEFVCKDGKLRFERAMIENGGPMNGVVDTSVE